MSFFTEIGKTAIHMEDSKQPNTCSIKLHDYKLYCLSTGKKKQNRHCGADTKHTEKPVEESRTQFQLQGHITRCGCGERA